MGQYLTIGLVTGIAISKGRAKAEAKATPEEVRDVLQKTYNQNDIYLLGEDEDAVWLTLRPEVAEAEMPDFLTDFYHLHYSNESRSQEYVKKALDMVRSKSTLTEWLDLAKNGHLYYFKEDSYVWVTTPFSRGVWDYRLTTRATQIMLSMDGKILMECYGGLFDVFTRLFRERLSKYRLAGGLLVAISG